MKILIIHQYFNTPQSGGPLRSYYLACGLSSHGHEVEVITSHKHHCRRVEEINGFKVTYLPVFYDNKLEFHSRIFSFLKFAWYAYRKALQVKNIDLCYAISTPLTIGWVAKQLKARRSIPYIFEVGDLWPEAPVQMGVIRSPWIIRRIRRFERSIYQEAERIVALSPGIRSSILKSSPSSQVTTIPNMADCQFFQAESKSPHLEREFGVQDKLVVSYFGAAGKANHLEYLIEAARLAQAGNRQLHFLIVAQGSELNRLKKLVKRYRLSNLDFLEYRNRADLRQVLNVTDVVYVSYADVPILTTGSPNKFFDGLAAGKLMIVNFKGWLKEIVERHQIGFYVNPKAPHILTDLLDPFVSNKDLLRKSQANSRLIAETFFSRELAVRKLLGILYHEELPSVKEQEVYNLIA